MRSPSAQIVVLISCVAVLCFCVQAAMPVTPNTVPCPLPKGPILGELKIPTLVLHGEDDQIVPVKNSAKKSARLIKGAKEIYYPRTPHGLTATHQDKVNADLLAFLPEAKKIRAA